MDQRADLYFGVATGLLFSALSFCMARYLWKRSARRVHVLLSIAPLAIVGAHVLWLRDSLFLVKLLPFSNVVLIGNVVPLSGWFLAGCAWEKLKDSRIRRTVAVASIATTGLYFWLLPLFSSGSSDGNLWKDGVCLQTREANCAPAAAATLLRYHGMDVNEPDLVQACLTSERGTSTHGLYRGMKLGTERTRWEAVWTRTQTPQSAEELSGYAFPIMVSVMLKESDVSEFPRYEKEWGWIPGALHYVVLYGVTSDGKVWVGDPAVGKEQWSFESLRLLWHGIVAKLVERK